MFLDEEEIGTHKESLISFRLSRPNEEMSRDYQHIEMSASEANSVVQSPCMKPTRQPTCKEKGKLKMLEYGTNAALSD